MNAKTHWELTRDGAKDKHITTVELPMVLPSNANLREHWAQRAKRTRSQRDIVKLTCTALFRAEGVKAPCTVRLIRISPRPLDGDNLVSSFKAVQDGVADALGVDDRDIRVQWSYNQQRGGPKEHLLRIVVGRQ